MQVRPTIKRPMNLAHRGARKAAPENTLAAFALARDLGADGIELDTFLCASGELVVTHDDDLTVLSNGLGNISSTPLAKLKELDFGSHFSLSFRDEKIPTLQEVIDLLPTSMLINIEIKTLSLRPTKEVKAVVELVKKNNLFSRVLISSFNPVILYHLKKLSPNIARGLLFESRLPIHFGKINSSLLKLHALHPPAHLTNEKLMQLARKNGYQVNTWTVNEPNEMHRLIDLGVNSIITDYPDRLKQVFIERNLI